MSGLPLIPKSNCATNHDTSHILQEVFQDVLGGEVFPENIAENAEKFVIERKSLKERTTAVKNVFFYKFLRIMTFISLIYRLLLP